MKLEDFWAIIIIGPFSFLTLLLYQISNIWIVMTFRFFIKSPEEGRLVHPKYRKTPSRFSLCCFVINVSMGAIGSTFWGGPLFPVGPVGIFVEWIAPYNYWLLLKLGTSWDILKMLNGRPTHFKILTICKDPGLNFIDPELHLPCLIEWDLSSSQYSLLGCLKKSLVI